MLFELLGKLFETEIPGDVSSFLILLSVEILALMLFFAAIGRGLAWGFNRSRCCCPCAAADCDAPDGGPILASIVAEESDLGSCSEESLTDSDAEETPQPTDSDAEDTPQPTDSDPEEL